MTAMTALTEAGFDAELARSTVPVLVDFWAEGCQPCAALVPVLQELAHRAAGRLRVGTVRLDDNPGLAARFAIMTLPTLILFVDGRPIRRLTDVQGRQDLEERLEDGLQGALRK